jgi:hypothetical protein
MQRGQAISPSEEGHLLPTLRQAATDVTTQSTDTNDGDFHDMFPSWYTIERNL